MTDTLPGWIVGLDKKAGSSQDKNLTVYPWIYRFKKFLCGKKSLIPPNMRDIECII